MKLSSSLTVQFISLFPEVFEQLTHFSLMKRAIEKKLFNYNVVNPRDFTTDKHRKVDDKPYGGGPGMVLRADVMERAILKAREISLKNTPNIRPQTLFLSPQGERLTSHLAKDLLSNPHWILVCGHYEGFDDRLVRTYADRQISIGDYVLTGGELPALVLTDVALRFVDGVVGKSENVWSDSFEGEGKFKYPQFTKPSVFNGEAVPSILLSGDHELIKQWRDDHREPHQK